MSNFNIMNYRLYNWLITNPEFMKFLTIYEPKVELRERPELFTGFPIVEIYNFIEEPLYQVKIRSEFSEFFQYNRFTLCCLK